MFTEYFNRDCIFLHGHGLGGAVGCYMAEKNPKLFKGLILENTFTSIPDLFEDASSYFLRKFIWLLIRVNWDSKSIVKNLELPILYFHGEKDKTIPYSHTLRLHGISTKAKFCQKHIFPEANHISAWVVEHVKYFTKLGDFIRKCISIAKKPPILLSK